jgi:multiple sugar transport system permease protein
MIVGNKKRTRLMTTSRFVTLCLFSLVMVLPFLYMVSTSFKKYTYLFESPPQFIPKEPTLQNYVQAWTAGHFSRYFFNSLFVTSVSTVFTVVFASMAAFAFAKFVFFGKKVLFILLLMGLVVPGIVLIIPQFIIAKHLHLIDSFAGLILFYIGMNFSLDTFLLRGFMEDIPRELDDAMKVDGASAWTRFARLYVPLSRPALATVTLFSFLASWDEFAWAITLINSQDKRTLPIAIALFHGQHATSWGLVFAASLIALVPIIIVFLITQKHFVEGLSTGAVKG